MCSNAHREPKWHPPPELHRKQIRDVGTPEAAAAAVAAFIFEASPGLRSSSALWAKVQRSPLVLVPSWNWLVFFFFFFFRGQ